MMSSPVRVLVVDDSALMRKLIPQILRTDPSIEVVGTAIDGKFGLRKLDELNPQVVTLDLEMPGMGGIEMLKEITRSRRVPVIVVSSHSTQGAAVTLQALALGRCFSPHARDRGGPHPQDQSRCPKPGHANPAPSRNAPAIKKRAGSEIGTVAHRRGRCLDRRPSRLASHAAATAGRFSGQYRGCAAHAGGLHRHVCASPG